MTVQIFAGSWTLDLQSQELVLCSRSRQMLGVDGDSSKKLGKGDWLPRIHPDDVPIVEGELETAGRLDEIYTARFRAVRPDGSICQILGIGRAAVRDKTRFVGLNLDLDASAALADLESRQLPRGTMARFGEPLSVRQRPANENETRRGTILNNHVYPARWKQKALTRQMLLERALAMMKMKMFRHAARIDTIDEELGQRLAAISLAVGALEAGAEIAESVMLIRSAVEEMRRELMLHRYDARRDLLR
jgi:hypothetical protein